MPRRLLPTLSPFLDYRLTLAVIAAALAGLALGSLFADVTWLAHLMQGAKDLFLGALKLIVGPLILLSLISGVLRLQQATQMRRLGAVTVGYYLLTTGIAIVIGLGIVFWIHPWTAHPPLAELPTTAEGTLIDQASGDLWSVLLGLLRSALANPVAALADLNILALVTNGILFGLALLLTLPQDSPVIRGVHDLTTAIYRVAHWAVALVPLGVLGISFQLADAAEVTLVAQLGGFMAVVFGATLVHGLLVLPFLAWALTGVSPARFLRSVMAPATVALTTSSSAATLPVSMRTAEETLGVEPSVRAFVLPLGATINMDGTALFEGVAAVFLAYLFGVELGTAGMVVVFFVAMLASIGAPGIPSGSMAGMQVVLLAAGIPLEAIGLLLLVERPLDTFRTAVNVEGDLLACMVAQRFGTAHGT